MDVIGVSQAAVLLGISPTRLRYLLGQGRIQGAKKLGREWQIPLFGGGMPKVLEGSRGPGGSWRRRSQCSPTRIHVDSEALKRNISAEEVEPVLIVRRGNRVERCCELRIDGPCRIVYQPKKPRDRARLWIEVEPDVDIQRVW